MYVCMYVCCCRSGKCSGMLLPLENTMVDPYCCSFGSCTTWGPFKRGYIGKIFRQILSTPFRSKIDQNSFKTTPRGVGRMSRGIRQLIAPSSSNMSPWGPMADPFRQIFIDFRIFSKNVRKSMNMGLNKSAMGPHRLIFDEDGAISCPMPLDALPTSFKAVLSQF